MRPQFGTMPTPRTASPALAVLASSSCDWLAGRQNPDGSWGSGAALDRLISTCHVTMTLMCAGFSPQSAPLVKARNWLTSRTSAKHNNSYWILGPLARFPGVERSTLEREVRRLEQVLRSGAKPNPDQLVEAFYLRALEATGMTGDLAVVRKCQKYIVDGYTPEHGWSSRADTTTDGYSAVLAFAPDKAAEIRSEVEAFLGRHADWNGDRLRWGSLISTSYTIMNVVGSDLIDAPAVQKMILAAVRGLEEACRHDCYWDSEAPYGGSGDLKSVDYPTAVVVRALLAVSSTGDPAFQTHVVSQRLMVAQQRARVRGIVSASLLAALFATSLTPFDEFAVAWLGTHSSWDVGRTLSAVGSVLSFLMGALALVVAFAPEWTRILTSRIRRAMRF